MNSEQKFWLSIWSVLGALFTVALIAITLIVSVGNADERRRMIEIQKAGGDPARLLCAQRPELSTCGILLNAEKAR